MDKSTFISNVLRKKPDNFKIYSYDFLPPSFSCHDLLPISCNKHGLFHQSATRHLYTFGCDSCLKGQLRLNVEDKTTAEFIRKSKSLFGDRFSYDKTVCTGKDNRLTVTCKVHGDVDVLSPVHYQMKTGCYQCELHARLKAGLFKFLNDSRKIHGERYDYSKVIFRSVNHPVEIVCKVHGSFYQSPDAHAAKSCDCPKCARDADRHTTSSFIEKSRQLYGDAYDYSKVAYTVNSAKVVITCKVHGDFTQRAGGHLRGNGCGKCSKEKQKKDVKDFIADAVKLHGDKYDYSKVRYDNNKTKVEIVCRIHGSFFVKPNAHLGSVSGCKLCSESKGELVISTVLTDLGIRYQREYKIPPHRYRYDFYLPDADVFIEYHGQQHYRPVHFFGGEEAHRNVVFNDRMKESILKALRKPLIVIPYRFLQRQAVEDQLKLCLKRIFSVWVVVDGQVVCFKTTKLFREKYDLPDAKVTLEKTISQLNSLGMSVSLLF